MSGAHESFFRNNPRWPRVPTLRSRREGSLEDARARYKHAGGILGAVAAVVAYEEWWEGAMDTDVYAATTIFDYESDGVAEWETPVSTVTHLLRLAMGEERLAGRHSLVALSLIPVPEPPEVRLEHLGTPPRTLLDDYPDLQRAINAAMEGEGADI